MELLEPRIAPAGIVTISVVDGNLSIRGDAADNHFEWLQLSETSFQIIPLSGTLLKLGKASPGSDPLVIEGVTRNVTVNLGSGIDQLEAGALDLPGNLSILFGKGAAAASPSSATFGGDVAVAGAFRMQTSQPAQVIFGGENVNVGTDFDLKSVQKGNWNVTLPELLLGVGGTWSFSRATIAGDISHIDVTRDIIGSGNVELSTTDVEVGRDFALTGSLVMGVGASAWEPSMSIGRDLRITSTGNSSILSLDYLTVERAAVFKVQGSSLYIDLLHESRIGGNVSVQLQLASGTGETFFEMGRDLVEPMEIGGKFTVTTSGARAAASVSLHNLAAQQMTSVKSASGALSFTASDCDFGSLQYSSGGKDDVVSLNYIDVLGTTKISTGGGADRFQIEGANSFNSGLKVSLGGGDDIAILVPHSIHFGAVSRVDGGGNSDSVTLSESTNYTGSESSVVGFEEVVRDI